MDRPQFVELRKALEAGDTLLVTKLDRLARSATKDIELIDDLLSHGIKIHVLNMSLMDNTPTGKLIRTILLAFAVFERDMINKKTYTLYLTLSKENMNSNKKGATGPSYKLLKLKLANLIRKLSCHIIIAVCFLLDAANAVGQLY